jgi:mRNA-degrading endonuclease RelE of RelBE toxin-antitoxin system
MSVITVRVPRKIKKTLEKYNVNISETVRKLLEKYLEELERRDLSRRLETLKNRLGGKIQPKLIAKLVREDREAR